MLQNIVGDEDARQETAADWERAEALFATVGEDELLDPQVPPETLLYRLFHEDGVRLFPAKPLKAFCRCSEERVVGMLRTFPPTDRDDMAADDGRIHVTCEYCSKTYVVGPETVE
jgi:molecular chaperone Hsp33